MVLSLECRSIRGYSEGILMLTLHMTGYGFSQRRCRGAVEWFIFKYLPRHHITLEVLHRGLKRDGMMGYCTVQDCDWRPRSFLIEIQSTLNEKDYIITLLHELYHCYQHIRGDLRDKRGIRCWKGIDYSEVDYEDQPWEIEAYEMENVLYEEYLNHIHK
jgi:hypothetical protein